MKKLTSLLLALALARGLVIPAFAGGTSFPSVNAYPGFADVPAGQWYSDSVQTCYEVGLMNGTGNGFEPSKVLTVGEVAAIAARIRETLTGEAIPGITPPPGETLPWYQKYVGYLTTNGVTVPDPTQNATRQDFVDLLAAVVPQSQLTPLHTVTALPDTTNANMLAFHNAGIITGVNSYGTTQPLKTLTRAECATMVARLVRPTLRVDAPLAAPDRSHPTQYLLGLDADETVFTWCDIRVPAKTYYSVLYSMYASLLQQCNSQGVSFSWNITIGSSGNTMSAADYLSTYAPIYALQEAWMDTPAGQTAQASIPVYKAKHILVKDKTLADQITAQLLLDSSLFDALLAQYGEDPGMTANPDGYIFGPNEMVEEFEAGTAALSIGQISSPVQSQFGYHIILRLAPTDQEAVDYRQETFPAQAFDAYTAPFVGTAPAFSTPIDVKEVCDGMVRLAGAG